MIDTVAVGECFVCAVPFAALVRQMGEADLSEAGRGALCPPGGPGLPASCEAGR